MKNSDIATLEVVLTSDKHTVGDARIVLDALDGLVSAAIWGSIAAVDSGSEEVWRARQIMFDDMDQSHKAHRRFFPFFAEHGTIEEIDEEEFSPFDPMDAGIRDGLNSYLRRKIDQNDPELCRELFSFAELRKLEHNSPLLVELAIVVGAISLPIVLTYGLMRAAVSIRREWAEAGIREEELKIRQEEYKQKKLQTEIMKNIQEAAQELGIENIPKEAIAAAANVSTTAISDLGSKPLIGSVSLGYTKKS